MLWDEGVCKWVEGNWSKLLTISTVLPSHKAVTILKSKCQLMTSLLAFLISVSPCVFSVFKEHFLEEWTFLTQTTHGILLSRLILSDPGKRLVFSLPFASSWFQLNCYYLVQWWSNWPTNSKQSVKEAGSKPRGHLQYSVMNAHSHDILGKCRTH